MDTTIQESEIKTSYIFINSPRYTLLPNSVFFPADAKKYFNLNFGDLDSNERVYFTLNTAFEVSMVFGIKPDVDNFRNSLKQSVVIEHFSNLILKYLKLHISPYDPFLIITPKLVYFALREESKLLQLSAGEFDDENDIIYFLMAQLKSIGGMDFSSIHICSLNEVDTFSSEEFNLSLKSIKSFADKSIISIDADKLYSIL